MSELTLFLFGCFVSLVVAAAVAFLFYAVSTEPESGEDYDDEALVRPFDDPAQLDASAPPKPGFTKLEGGLADAARVRAAGLDDSVPRPDQARRVSDR